MKRAHDYTSIDYVSTLHQVIFQGWMVRKRMDEVFGIHLFHTLNCINSVSDTWLIRS